MAFQDYYAILGVPFGATAEQIERAYKLLVRMSHPDAFPGDPQAQAWANERMKDVNEAYTVLRNPQQRVDYDQTYGSAKAANEQSRQQETRQQREEPRVRCPLCEAHGRVTCPTCNGRGDWSCPGCEGAQVVVCPICQGTGSLTAAEYERLRQEVERSRRQAEAETARQEAEAAERQRAEEVRRLQESRRNIVMAGVGVLSLLFVARSCTADSRPPAVSRRVQTPVVTAPAPYQPPVQPRPTPAQTPTARPRPSLRSLNSAIPTKVTFRNETSRPVKVLWIDYDGREVLYRILASGESYMQSTYATHPWRVRDATTGRTLRTVVAGRSSSRVTVGQPRRAPAVAKQVPPRPTAQQLPRPPVASPTDQMQSDPTKLQVAEPAPTPIPRGPVARFLTELSPVFQFQTDFRSGGSLFGQPYQSAILHVNRSGFLMRTVYNLNGEYDRFEVTVGLESTGNFLQQAMVRIYGDGQQLYESPGLGTAQTVKISISVKGVNRLELLTTGLPVVMTIIWADPRLIKD